MPTDKFKEFPLNRKPCLRDLVLRVSREEPLQKLYITRLNIKMIAKKKKANVAEKQG